MATKKMDLAVKTGSYTNSQGETKNNYVNVGALMSGDNGDYILLDRTFNPAGVPNPENRGNVIVSMFVPKDKNAQAAPAQNTSAAPDDGIPF